MAAVLRLPTDDFLSDKYMEAFYKAHVASKTRGNIDEDIAAIEAEIKKVKKYRSSFRRCRYEHQLNSCGSSECSDEDDLDTTSESSTASVFKVSNSTPESYRSTTPPSSLYGAKDNTFVFPRGPDIFTWAVAQQIAHDHGYCKPETLANHTFIERGTVSMKSVSWHNLSPSQRAQAVHKLSCILQHRPSGRQSPTFSSFDLLPTSLANSIKKTGSLGLTVSSHTLGGSVKSTKHPKNPKTPSLLLTPTHKGLATHNGIGIKEVKSRERTHQKSTPKTSNATHKSSRNSGGPTRSSSRKRARHSPYVTRQHNTEVMRMRNVSSCSEGGEDPVIID